MTSTEDTQDLSGRLSDQYRYIVRHIGSRRKSPADYMPEFGTEVVDSWTGDVMTVHWALSAELSSLVAETQCAERNGAATAITFPSKLALFVGRARDAETNPGDILEDVDRILEWHLSHVRGLSQEPLDQTRLYVQAPEFNG
jgi:hypothetical protein